MYNDEKHKHYKKKSYSATEHYKKIDCRLLDVIVLLMRLS